MRSIFTKTLRDDRTALFWWSVGITAYVFINVLSFNSVQHLTGLNDLVKQSPNLIKAIAGNIDSLTSPAGYLDSKIFFLIGPLLLAVYAISHGASAIAGEEGAHTLPLLLATPLSRTRILFEKMAALVAGTSILGLVFFLTTWLSSRSQHINLSTGHIFDATAGMVLLALLFGFVALMVGATTGRRSLAASVSGALLLFAYTIQTLAVTVPKLGSIQKFTPWYYYSHHDPLLHGLSLSDALVLLVGIVIATVIAVWRFARRDIQV